jgi:hypothetical protein
MLVVRRPVRSFMMGRGRRGALEALLKSFAHGAAGIQFLKRLLILIDRRKMLAQMLVFLLHVVHLFLAVSHGMPRFQ